MTDTPEAMDRIALLELAIDRAAEILSDEGYCITHQTPVENCQGCNCFDHWRQWLMRER